MGAAILDLTSWGPPSWTGSDVKNSIVAPILLAHLREECPSPHHLSPGCTLLYVHSSIAIILMGKRELIALLNLSSWCLVMVERLFLAVPRGCLQFVIVVFPDHTHLLFLCVYNILNNDKIDETKLKGKLISLLIAVERESCFNISSKVGCDPLIHATCP